MAMRTVSTVLRWWFGICATNSAIQEYLCQEGFGFTSNGASLCAIHLMPLRIVAQLFQTSALLADSWPPLAKEVSIPA